MPADEAYYTITFEVEVRTFQGQDSKAQRSVVTALWTHLQRAFGADRCKVSVVDSETGVKRRVPYLLADQYDLQA